MLARTAMLALALLAPVGSGAAEDARGPDGTGPDTDAAAAYRAGDYASARALWTEALAESGEPHERARLCYDLGNAAYRAGAPLEAVGWYTAALRLEPRDGDAWANLELVRAELGLDPADRGDLTSTLVRLLSSLNRAEADWLLCLGIALLVVALAGEALRGRPWRRAVWGAVALLALAAGPRLWHATRTEHPALIVQKGGAAGRSEPREDAKTLARLEAGEEVERRDALPGWVQVEDGEGRRLWLREGAVFDLAR